MPALHDATSYSLEPQTVSRRLLTWISRREDTIRRVTILTVLYLLPAMWILQPVIIDPDLWWHLQTGKWMVEHGMLPTTDPFSAYGEGKPWVPYSWLFEIGMYGLVQLCGERGVVLYTLVGIWLTMLILHRIIGSRYADFVIVSGLLAVSIVALSKMFTPRPWLFTLVFFAITLEVILSLREGKQSRWFWLLPLVYLVWANIHIQFIYGLGLLGLACVAPLADRFVHSLTGFRPVVAWNSSQWKQLVGLTAVCTLATLATPHHVRLYSIVVELAAQTGMWDYTQEFQAPAFRTFADWAMLMIFSLALVYLGWRRSWSSFDVLLVLVGGASAFRGQRDIWFLVLASLAVLVTQRSCNARERWTIVPREWFAPITTCVVAGVICILGYRGFSEAKIHENTARVYPIKAASFVEQQGYAGPLYNHFDWGGYLIWRLPHLKVSMDGRANVHGDDRIKRSISTWTGTSHWTEDPELNEANVVIAQRELALSALLRLDPRFQVAYQDDTAVVFTRVARNPSQSNFPAVESPLPASTAVDVTSTP